MEDYSGMPRLLDSEEEMEGERMPFIKYAPDALTWRRRWDDGPMENWDDEMENGDGPMENWDDEMENEDDGVAWKEGCWPTCETGMHAVDGEGRVLKRSLVAGKGACPELTRNTVLSVAYTLRVKGTRTPLYSTEHGTVDAMRLGDERMVAGMELALKSMERGETAVFAIAADMAYGAEDTKFGWTWDVVPGGSSLWATVHLASWRE